MDQFDIDVFAQSIPEPVQYPEGAVKNRAAITAMLSDPFHAVQNYQTMVSEASFGESAFTTKLSSDVQAAAKQSAFQTAVSMLSDPNLSIEEKKRAVAGLNDFKIDSSILLQSNALKAGSKGESFDHEKARVNAAEAIYELHKERIDAQGLSNSVGLSLDNSSASKALFEMIDLYIVPFGGNSSMGQFYSQMSKAQGKTPSMLDVIRAAMLQGSTKDEWLSKIAKMPPEKATEFRRLLADTIKESRRVVFSKDSDFEKYDLSSTLLGEDNYSTVEKTLDNISGFLDVIGLGFLGKEATKVTKALKAGKNIPKPVSDAVAAEAKTISKAFEEEAAAKRAAKQAPAIEALKGAQPPQEQIKKTAKSVLDILNAPVKPSTSDDVLSILKGEKKRSEILQRKLAEIDQQIAEKIVADKKLVDAANEERQARYMVLKAIDESNISPEAKAAARRQALLKSNSGIESFVKMKDALDRKGLNAVARQENPSSVARIVQSANPEQARNLHAEMQMDATGQVAEAIYGTSRVDAIAQDVLPQIGTATRVTSVKVPAIASRVDEIVRELSTASSGVQFTQRERQAAKAKIVNDFRTADGLTINDAESLFELDGNKIRIVASYGNANGSWSDAERAVEHATSALRQYGVGPHEIVVLEKQGLDRVPVSLDEVRGKEGDYTIQVAVDHPIDARDIGNLDSGFKVKLNWFDRIPWFVWNRQGSVSRYLLDASSMLDPIFTKSAVISTDASARFTKILLEIATDFSDSMKGLSNQRKAKLEEYFREANEKGLPFNAGDLLARGFTQQEIDAVSKWRKYWDTHYYLENLDMVRTLDQQGFQKFKNPNLEAYAKPVPKNQNLGEVYDPVTDKIVIHSKTDGDSLYANGGTYAKLRRPLNINGTEVEHIIVPNSPTAYLRKVRDTDEVLNYREGYFQIQYTSPRFIDVSIKNPNGTHKYWKAIAVAGDTKEAERWMKQYAAANSVPVVDFKIRGDERALTRDSDSWWDVNSVSGRIAQRHRGVQLEDAQGLNHVGAGSYIMNPVDSAVRAARSIAGRTVTRDVLETMKARFLQMYGHLINEKEGIKHFPYDKSAIGVRGGATTKEVADARTTFEYINYLENGYLNLADEGFKAMFNALGETLAGVGLGGKAERAMYNISELNPSAMGKKGVFYAYIALNPLRQWIVQSHQFVRTIPYNPKGFFSGTMFKEFANLLGVASGAGGNKAAADKFMSFIEESGMLDAVDMHNLVRGSLADSIEKNGILRFAEKGVEIPRKVGFDIGERTNLVIHLSAVYDKYKRAGKNLDDAIVRGEAYSEARALSYDMNFAGDMPYNQTLPSLILQFMQVPHKALLQLTNRRLDVPTRMRLVTFDMLMWGTPFATVANMFGEDVLPEDPELREFVLWGFESIAINRSLSLLAGEKVSLDTTSLAPYQTIDGWSKIFEGIYSGGLAGALANSPAGTFYPKVWDVARKSAMFLGAIETPVEDPIEFTQVLNSIAKLSSGWANWVKMQTALEMKKKLSAAGEVIDPEVNNTEAIGQLFGFGTQDEKAYWETITKEFKSSKQFKDDVNKVYDDIKKLLLDQADSDGMVANYDFITKVSGTVMNVFKHDPEAQKIILDRLNRDVQNPEDKLALVLLRNAGVVDGKAFRDRVLKSPLPQEKKDIILRVYQDFQDAQITDE